MRTRSLGKTGFFVSELALGTWGLSGDGYGSMIDAEVDRTIDRALALGITLFDTADIYGKGAMEKKLGARLPKSTDGDDRPIVVTKVGTDLEATPARKRFDPDFLKGALDRSAERLDRPHDVVLLHNPSLKTLEKGEAAALLKERKNEHKLHAWGVSAGSVDIARKAIEEGADVIELVYNLTLSADLHVLADVISEKGTGILARSVLAHGLLAGQWTADRDFYPGDHRAGRWTREELKIRISQLDAIRPIALRYVQTIRSLALRFALANQLVCALVLGPRSVAQLEQLVKDAGEGPPYLADTALAEVSARLNYLGLGTPPPAAPDPPAAPQGPPPGDNGAADPQAKSE